MQKYFVEARQLLALAIPVILAQVAQTAMGFVDTVMAGGYSATDMAAVAIGTSIWLPAILFGHGLLLALTPVVAQLNGSGRRERIAPQVRQGFWLAGFVSVLIMVVLWNAGLSKKITDDIRIGLDVTNLFDKFGPEDGTMTWYPFYQTAYGIQGRAAYFNIDFSF